MRNLIETSELQSAEGWTSTIVNGVLITTITFAADLVGVVQFPWAVFGVSGFYVGAPIITLAALAGGRAAFPAIYVGLLAAAAVTGRFSAFALVLNFCNLFGVLFPYLIYRVYRSDWRLRGPVDVARYIWWAGIIQSTASAMWFFGGLWLVGAMDGGTIKMAAIGWISGGVAAQFIVGVPLILAASKLLRRRN
ncbi:hypothetical protein QO002_003280 [Pararhizobium capsulatum DSM 1112]|uniref:Uncharacterized protein n=1 Tax=Pararhizobium capsulatum DSM 1112 TaxID=1121113 RepID=A0ABU0BWB6_9HYPH|nr:hypothetical protein [Pararhizobium capsulatum]MDQ0321142.1 hypothetical protein [Pararhizobium capsulatum DSM 1112]